MRLKLVNIFVVLLVELVLVFVFNIEKIKSATSPWIQTNWIGGSNQSAFVDSTKYYSSDSVIVSTDGEISLSKEKLSNVGFEVNSIGWNISSVENEPSDISGLKLWLKADAITGLNDGDIVTSWIDSSGNNYTASQSDDAKKAVYKINILNSKPIIRFDGSNDIYSLPSGALDMARNVSGLTILAVTKAEALGRMVFIATNAGGNRANWGSGTNNRQLIGRRLDGDSAQAFSGGSYTWNEFDTEAVNVNYATASLFFYKNGTQVATTTTFQTAGNTSDTNSSFIYVGGDGASSFWKGDIAEVIIYSKTLSDVERNNVNEYLSKKYSIACALPYSITRDTTITYNSSVGSGKIVASIDTLLAQSVNVGDTNNYTLTAYAYTDGNPITSNDAELYYNNAIVSTVYTPVGSNWYRLTASITGVNASRNYGILVKANRTIYLDDFSLWSNSSYSNSGNLISSIFDAETRSNWETASYNAITPTGTSVSLYARSGAVADLSDAASFSTCQIVTNNTLLSLNNCIKNSDRYLQYKVVLATTNTLNTPRFNDISLAFSQSDRSPPSGTISINYGDTSATCKYVNLGFSVTDDFDQSSTILMQVSNDSSFTGASWEAFAATKAWTFSDSSDGKKTVYVRYKDMSGNISGSFSDDILLDARGNLICNAGFESGNQTLPDSWTYSTLVAGDSFVWDTSDHHYGDKSLRINAVDPAQINRIIDVKSDYVEVVPNGLLEASAWFKVINVVPINPSYVGWFYTRLRLEMYDASHTLISPTYADYGTKAGSTNGWINIKSAFIVPNNAKYIKADIKFIYSTGTLLVDDIDIKQTRFIPTTDTSQVKRPVVIPTPMQMTNGNMNLPLGDVAVVSNSGETYLHDEVDEYFVSKSVTHQFLTLSDPALPNYSTVVYFGNDSISTFNDELTKKFPGKSWSELGTEGYFVTFNKVNNQTFVYIGGNSEKARFYGFQTVKQLITNTDIYIADIIDKPTVARRGITMPAEWYSAERFQVVDASSEMKMNFMWNQGHAYKLIADQWRTPFTAPELALIQTYVDYNKKHFLDLYISVSPRGLVQPLVYSSSSDIDVVVDKMDSLYGVGLRGFGLSFDDLETYNEARLTDPADITQFDNDIGKAHKYFMTEVYNRLKSRHSDIKFMVVPLRYNHNSNSTEEQRDYLRRMGELPIEIELFCDDYYDEHADTLYSLINRPYTIWDNMYAFTYPNKSEPQYVIPSPKLLSWNNTAEASKIAGYAFLPRTLKKNQNVGVSWYTTSDLMWSPQRYDENSSYQQTVASSLSSYGATSTQAAIPVISPSGGSYNGFTEVTLSSSTLDTQIYYTIDGGNPSNRDTLYSGPFLLSQDTNLKAIAIKTGYTPSNIFDKRFEIKLDDTHEVDIKSSDTFYTNSRYPSFKFEVPSNLDNIEKFQIIVHQNGKAEYVLIDDIEKSSSGNERSDSDKKVTYTDEIIKAYLKDSSKKLEDGEYYWNVRTIFSDGNHLDSDENKFIVDTIKPYIELSFIDNLRAKLLSDVSTNNTFTIYNQKPLFKGKGEIGSSISIEINSEAITCSTTVDNNANWSCQIAAAIPLGSHILKISSKDKANNTNEIANVNLIVSNGELKADIVDETAKYDETVDSNANKNSTAKRYNVKIIIINQLEKTVKNAQVVLDNNNKSFTNDNGEALFNNISSGDYYVQILYKDKTSSKKINVYGGTSSEYIYTIKIEEEVDNTSSNSTLYMAIGAGSLVGIALMALLIAKFKKKKDLNSF